MLKLKRTMHHNSRQVPTGGTLLSTSGLPILAEAAFHGLAGKIVHAIASFTEAHPTALLGALRIERGAFVIASGTKHFPNEFLAIVRISAGARKSTAVANSRTILDRAGVSPPTVSGLVSGEGIIEAICDAKPKAKPDDDDHIDAGVEDKRLLAIETELVCLTDNTARTQGSHCDLEFAGGTQP